MQEVAEEAGGGDDQVVKEGSSLDAWLLLALC